MATSANTCRRELTTIEAEEARSEAALRVVREVS